MNAAPAESVEIRLVANRLSDRPQLLDDLLADLQRSLPRFRNQPQPESHVASCGERAARVQAVAEQTIARLQQGEPAAAPPPETESPPSPSDVKKRLVTRYLEALERASRACRALSDRGMPVKILRE